MSKTDRDPVKHYMRGGIECITAMRAISTPEEFRGYLRLTAFKYLWRLGEKDLPAREAKKARDYITWLESELAVELVEEPPKPTKTINGVTYEVLSHGGIIRSGDLFSFRDDPCNLYEYMGGIGTPRCNPDGCYWELRPVK